MKKDRTTLFAIRKFACWNSGKYLLIFLLLLGVTLYGKNFKDEHSNQAYMHEINRLSSAEQGVYFMDQDMNELVLEEAISVSPNNGYRILFDAFVGADSAGNGMDDKINLSVSVKDRFGSQLPIKSYQLSVGEKKVSLEGVFASDDFYRDLVFTNNNENYNGVIRIENIRTFAISANTQAEIKDLKESIVGRTDFNKTLHSNWSDQAEHEYVFRRKQQKICQIFVANSDTISAVDLRLKFVGTGGIGNYYLELYGYNSSDESIFERLAFYSFDRARAIEQLLLDDVNNIYRIPMVANLTYGKQYMFCINNDKTEFNPLNTLIVLGQNKQFENNDIFTLVRGQHSNMDGSLLFKLYGAEFSDYEGGKIPTGAIIQDIGGGKGLYTYKQNGRFSDFLDISEIGGTENDNPGIFYDNSVNGIAGEDNKDTSIIYTFNTVYPFDKFSISADQPGGNYTDSKFYISFDKVNWQEVQMRVDIDSPKIVSNKFEIITSGDGKQNVIYIKIICDQESKTKKISELNAAKLFGIKNINVEAELRIK